MCSPHLLGLGWYSPALGLKEGNFQLRGGAETVSRAPGPAAWALPYLPVGFLLSCHNQLPPKDTWGLASSSLWGSPVPCRGLGSIPGLPRCQCLEHLSSCCDRQTHLQTWPNVPGSHCGTTAPRGKSQAPGEGGISGTTAVCPQSVTAACHLQAPLAGKDASFAPKFMLAPLPTRRGRFSFLRPKIEVERRDVLAHLLSKAHCD